MALEIIAEPTGAPTGSFTPHADQSKFRSAFGIIAGDGKGQGFISGHSLQNGIPTADGRAKLKFTEFKDPTSKGFHDVKFNGLTLREFVCDKDDAAEKDRYDGNLSNQKVQSYIAPVNIANSPTVVGLQKSGEVSEMQAAPTQQY